MRVLTRKNERAQVRKTGEQSFKLYFGYEPEISIDEGMRMLEQSFEPSSDPEPHCTR